MKMNQQLSAMFLVLTVLMALTGCNSGRSVQAAREAGAPVSQTDQTFMTKATQANLSEMDMARLAMQKSDNIDVQNYANMIKSDHETAIEDLTDLMRSKNVPQTTNIPSDAKQDIARMDRLTGPEFDREFVNIMVADHQKAVETFRDAATTAENQDVKKYAADLLPKLEMHLEKAQRLQSELFRGPITR